MVARAQKRKWIDLVAGLLVGAAAQPLALLAGPDVGFPPPAAPGTTLAQPGGGPSRARQALSAAIEAERLGDLDRAALLYREAQSRANDLPPDERRELVQRLTANTLAVQSRRQAAHQIILAESALQQGRAAEAAGLIKKITVNELYLAPADKQRFQTLCQRLHFQPNTAPSTAPSSGVNNAAEAHAKLRQAREALAKSDLAAAETLARQADQLHVTYSPQEDSPKRVIDDLEKARHDAKTLFQAARMAWKRGEAEHAEQLARAAKEQASPFTFMMGDSPDKLLKEIQNARPPSADQGATAGQAPQAPAVPAPQNATTEKARILVREGRQALQRGDVAGARKCGEQAAALHGNLPWFEDNPVKLLEDVNRAAPPAKAEPAEPPGKKEHPSSTVKSKDEALALLKEGREQLARGELDKANTTAAHLRTAHHLHWGYFEDTPDKFQVDVDHARLKHYKEDSVELLAEARRRLAKHDYDTAERLAYEAQSKHGQYSFWDFGDRPSKLLAEVQSARQKEHLPKLPEPPKTHDEVAKLDHGPLARPNGNNPAQPNSVMTAAFTTPADARLTEARQIMKDARQALNDGAPLIARQLADRVRGMRVMLPPGDDTPENIYRDVERRSPRPQGNAAPTAIAQNPKPPQPLGNAAPTAAAQNSKPSQPLGNVAPTAMAQNPKAPQPPRENVMATRARRLLVEARALQRQNRLIEAREKAIEAQRMGVSFRPDEDNPGQVLQQVAWQARQHIDGLVRHAEDTLRYGTRPPQERSQEAEHDLTQARQLAAAFGQDVKPIEMVEHLAQQLRTSNPARLVNHVESNNVLPPPSVDRGGPPPQKTASSFGPAAPSGADPMQLLDKARLELRSGETANARRLAEEAIQHGAGKAGLEVLRSVDAEERAQERRRTNSAFDAVVSAYYRHEYRQAGLMLANVDTKQLDERRQARLREMLNTPEMQPHARDSAIALTSGQSPAAPDLGSHSPSQPQLLSPGDDAGHAHAGDDPGHSLLKRTQAMREIKAQQLRNECVQVEGQALERFRAGQTEQATEMLQEFKNRLVSEQLDPGQLSLLLRKIDSRLQAFDLLRQQAELTNNRFDDKSRQVKRNVAQAKNAEQVKQVGVARLMKEYNDLYRVGKYAEAEMVAMRVHDLDPDNPVATAAMTIARTQRNHHEYEDDKQRKEDFFIGVQHEADRAAGGADGASEAVRHDIALSSDPDRLERIRRRKSLDGLTLPRKSADERRIEQKLMMPVTLSFVNTPLRQIVQDIRGEQGINIFVDEPALAEKGIGLDSTLSIQLDQIALKSGLKLLLRNMHLTYVVADDVLKITTEEQARGKLAQRVYQVTDLVVPIENFGQVGVESPAQLGMQIVNQSTTPSAPMMQMPAVPGQPSVPFNGSMANNPTNFASDPGNGSPVTVTKSRQQTHEDMLIKLVTSTIEPQSWADQGGPGTIEYHPMTMALIINQTPDIQDQVQDLLNALRRLIDQEVAVEVRFISIAEDFFERIGVNFNMNIVNHSRAAQHLQPLLTSGQFAQPGYINQFQPGNFLSGLTPAGTLTNTLNIPITTSTYEQAVPPFGGYPGVPGFGGVTLGLAFLSDIQVFLFMEAVQGDIRSNVMQAPKLTLFNGQTANLFVQDFQFFTIGVNITNGGFGQLIYNPLTTLFPLGTSMTIQAVISGDRRFVRMSMQPFLRNIVNGEVNLFPVVTPIFPLFDGTATGQPVVFTQFVQQPRLTAVSVMTTVAVPDGGTVLMGGLKRLSEGRNEFGPPIISKIPYLSRLFRNVGYGRSVESLLIMVTPRIIIQAEEEEKQTGYVPPPAVTGIQ